MNKNYTNWMNIEFKRSISIDSIYKPFFKYDNYLFGENPCKSIICYGDLMFEPLFRDENYDSTTHEIEIVELCDEIEWSVILIFKNKYKNIIEDLVSLSYKEFRNKYNKLCTGDIQLVLKWIELFEDEDFKGVFRHLDLRYKKELMNKYSTYDFIHGNISEKYTGYEFYHVMMMTRM